VVDEDDRGLRGRLRRSWRTFAERVTWTPPTSTEIALVAKAGLAAAMSWWLAVAVTDVPNPVLAPLAALITVQVSVRASVRNALQRSAAVVLGVFLAIGVGDTFGLNALTVGLLTGASLGVAQLLLRLPRPAATQVPVSILVVMTALASRQKGYGWQRSLDTILGAAVGVAVSLAFPASRVADARQTLGRLATALGGSLDTMSKGLQATWTTTQTTEWRRTARIARERLVAETKDAVGSGREAAHWNFRDRRNIVELGRYEEVLPRLERTAIGVSSISRGLDDYAHQAGGEHRPMPDMALLFAALGDLIRVLVRDVLGERVEGEETRAFDEVRLRRAPCARAAFRQARRALANDEDPGQPEGEWMSYTALLVQVDRIVDDLRAPLPA
jgi:Fusaric acid resistance protein-like